MLSRGLIARLGLALFGCLLAIGVFELTLRVVWSRDNRYYVWPPHYSETFVPDPEVVHGVSPVARFQVNSQGLRGQEWSSDRAAEYRILAVGGSTTESLYLDQARTWPAVLQTSLGATADGRTVWVGSAARSGLNSRDHLALMQRAIDQLDVDVIAILLGANDLRLPLYWGDRYDSHAMDDPDLYWEWLASRSFMVLPWDRLSQRLPWYRRTATWEMGRRLRGVYWATMQPDRVQDRAGHIYRAMRDKRQQAPMLDDLPAIDAPLDEFERNVEAIVREARQRNIRLILMTQPVLWKAEMPDDELAVLTSGDRPDGAYYSPAALAGGMDAVNQRLLQTCARVTVECLDLAAAIPQTLEVFYDDMHFTEAGASRVAAELGAYLQERPPFAVDTPATP